MKQQAPSVAGGSESRQKVNKSSQLLTKEENDQISGLLGRKCQSMCTAVVQVYKTEASAHAHWKKKHTGVLCFIKDSSKRSYFLRVYCLIANDLVWEHEVYDTLKLNRARPFLLTFEGQTGHIALNFASDDECDIFQRVTDATIENRNRKRQERRSRPKSQVAPAIPTTQPVVPEENDITSTKVTLRNHPKVASMQIIPSPIPVAAVVSKPSFISSSKDKKKGKKYTKADISTPMNFVHISHVGWDAQKGFDLTGSDDDEMLKHFFNKAGVSQQQLNDRDTRAFIYDFVQSNNVLASVKSEQVEKPKPPPVPTRHQQNQNGTPRTAPPPPPQRQPPPPIPIVAPTPPAPPTIPRGPPPSRPPPIATAISSPSTAPAPPPPPPPPQIILAPPPPPMPQPISESNLKHIAPPSPIANDTRSALMDSIRKGATLKKVDPATLSTGSGGGGDSRSDLLSEIRQGIELRHVDPSQSNRGSDNSGGTAGATDALADALRRALQERGRAIHSSDDDTGESSDNDGEWED